jgi:zinc protease
MKQKLALKPIIHELPMPILQQPEVLTLDNGLKLFVLRSTNAEIFKAELIVEAGRPHETDRLTSRGTSRQIREGSRQYSSDAFAELFDFHGASLSVPTQMDVACFQLFTLRRHAHVLVPALADALMYPAFGKLEFDVFTRTSVAELQMEMSKPESMAYRYLTEFLYGAEHAYGYNSTPEMYASLTPDHLRAFHAARYTPKNTSMILSGNITDDALKLVSDTFGAWTVPEAQGVGKNLPKAAPYYAPKHVHLPLKKSEQSAIKIGRRMFNRHHPDYLAMGLLNTVLGGYFGSRLMSNVREKQGLTYNIYSSYDVLRSDGFFYIASEVNKRKTQKALTAIYGEMKRLQDEPIPQDELQMVHNYISGMMLMATDGSLNQSNLLKSLVIDSLTIADFEAEMEKLRGIGPETLQRVAQEWLKPEEMWQVIV